MAVFGDEIDLEADNIGDIGQEREAWDNEAVIATHDGGRGCAVEFRIGNECTFTFKNGFFCDPGNEQVARDAVCQFIADFCRCRKAFYCRRREDNELVLHRLLFSRWRGGWCCRV